MTKPGAARHWAWAALPLLVLCLAYVPDMGHGFVKDDFAWIAGSRVAGWGGLVELFRRDNGFYRPVVALTFAADERLFGLRPFGYAATNLLLTGLAGAAVVLLARGLGLPRALALLAGSLWALNWHGVGGAIMWISGRTALLLVLFATLAAAAFVRGRPLAAALAAFLALLSKEEAVLLPLILAAWAGLRDGGAFRWRRGLQALALFVPGLVAYLWLRAGTSAYLPGSAPPFYSPSFAPGLLVRNALEYADRAATFPAVAIVLAALALRRVPRLAAAEARLVALGLVWLAGGYGLTLFLPVRSSLYACFPSVGAALAAAAVVGALWREATGRAGTRLLVAAVVAALALVPLLRSRNGRLERTAAISAQALAEVTAAAPELAAGRWLVLRDTDERVNLRAAFGTLVEVAVRLQTGVPGARAWIEPPPPDWRQAGLEPPGGQPCVVLELRRDGQVARVR